MQFLIFDIFTSTNFSEFGFNYFLSLKEYISSLGNLRNNVTVYARHIKLTDTF